MDTATSNAMDTSGLDEDLGQEVTSPPSANSHHKRNIKTQKPKAKKKQKSQYKKAPEAPKRFKPPYMFFSREKYKDLCVENGKKIPVVVASKILGEAWSELPPHEKKTWEDMAERDKARYKVEKSMYRGRWTVERHKRARKDPTAPKRPVSAYLAYSNRLRAQVKRENPEFTNDQVSKRLAEMWKGLSEEEKSLYFEKVAVLRGQYKVKMEAWHSRNDEMEKAERKEREELALRKVDQGQGQTKQTSERSQSIAADWGIQAEEFIPQVQTATARMSSQRPVGLPGPLPAEGHYHMQPELPIAAGNHFLSQPFGSFLSAASAAQAQIAIQQALTINQHRSASLCSSGNNVSVAGAVVRSIPQQQEYVTANLFQSQLPPSGICNFASRPSMGDSSGYLTALSLQGMQASEQGKFLPAAGDLCRFIPQQDCGGDALYCNATAVDPGLQHLFGNSRHEDDSNQDFFLHQDEGASSQQQQHGQQPEHCTWPLFPPNDM